MLVVIMGGVVVNIVFVIDDLLGVNFQDGVVDDDVVSVEGEIVKILCVIQLVGVFVIVKDVLFDGKVIGLDGKLVDQFLVLIEVLFVGIGFYDCMGLCLFDLLVEKFFIGKVDEVYGVFQCGYYIMVFDKVLFCV